MTSLLRRLASNGRFGLSTNRHREGKFRNYQKNEKILAFGRRIHVFVTQNTPAARPPKDVGAVLTGRPHAHATIELTMRA